MQSLQLYSLLQGERYRIFQTLGQGGSDISYLTHNEILDEGLPTLPSYSSNEIRSAIADAVQARKKTGLIILRSG